MIHTRKNLDLPIIIGLAAIIAILLAAATGFAQEKGVVIRDIPYSEDFETQFRAFLEFAGQKLAGERCSHATVMAEPKDDATKVVTVTATCVRYHDEEVKGG